MRRVISVDMGGGGKSSCCFYEDVAPALACTHYGEPVIAYEDEECDPEDSGGCERDKHGKKAGKGALIQWERSATLGVSQDQTLFVWKKK